MFCATVKRQTRRCHTTGAAICPPELYSSVASEITPMFWERFTLICWDFLPTFWDDRVYTEASEPKNFNAQVYEKSANKSNSLSSHLHNRVLKWKQYDRLIVPLLRMLFRTSLDKPRFAEERANPGERRNMCVIFSNRSLAKWQEQVCSPVFLSEQMLTELFSSHI